MSFWKLAIVCLVVFTVSADIDTDIELYDDFIKERLELLSIGGGARAGGGGARAGGGGARAGGASSSIGRSSGSSSIGKTSGSISKPSSHISKPSAPISKPSAPISKPSAPISKPSAPISKPSAPIHKPGTSIGKPATVVNPPKPINKPSTPSTPSTKPVTSPTTNSGSVANNQAYIKQLWNLENGAKKGFDSKTGMWTGNAAPEKGGKTDYGPGLKLPYQKGGYNQAQIDKAVTDKITGIESTLRKNVEKLGKNYDNLSDTQKKLLVDYSYNTGNSFSVFPKFSKAVVEGDKKTMNAEYKRYWVDKSGTRQEVKGRNEWTKSVIDGFGK